MALRDDAVVLVAVGGAAWYFFKYLRTNAINTLTDLIPAVSPPGYAELQTVAAETAIQPTGRENQFTSPLADFVTGAPAGTVYAIRANDPALYIVMDSGEWYESGFTKGDLVNKSAAYYRKVTGLLPYSGYVQTVDTGTPFP